MDEERGVTFSGNVIYALPYLEMGGTERHVLSLIEGIQWAHRPVVIAPTGPMGQAIERAGAHVLAFDTVTGVRSGRSFQRVLGQAVALMRQSVSPAESSDAELKAAIDPPIIFHVHGGAELVWGARRLLGRRSGLKPLFSAHGYFGSGATFSYWVSARLLQRYNTPMIAVSRSEKERFVRMGMPESRISLIYNGVVDPIGAAPTAHRTDSPGGNVSAPTEKSLIVGTVARMVRNKGLDVLIKAISLLRGRSHPVRLVIYGDGPERDGLRKLATDLGIGRYVEMPGRVPNAAKEMRRFDIFCLPSRDEAFPLVLLEAEANGLPIVATSVAGIPDIVADGETGYLVPPDDVGRLTDALGRLITDRDNARRMGSAGRARYLEHFTVEKMCKNTVAVYQDLLQSHS